MYSSFKIKIHSGRNKEVLEEILASLSQNCDLTVYREGQELRWEEQENDTTTVSKVTVENNNKELQVEIYSIPKMISCPNCTVGVFKVFSGDYMQTINWNRIPIYQRVIVETNDEKLALKELKERARVLIGFLENKNPEKRHIVSYQLEGIETRRWIYTDRKEKEKEW